MKIAYFDCFAGISGDMSLGALVGAGADFESLKAQLATLQVDGYTLEIEKKITGHIEATNVHVHLEHHHHHHHRGLPDILKIIESSGLSGFVTDTATRVFRRLAEAEGKVHGKPADEVHFHEVGAVDAIVDIVGAAICLELLGCPTVVASPMPTFFGFAHGSHGTFPLPAPATAEILRGVPWRKFDAEGELITPTGAAIITTIASSFGPMPEMTVESIGYGSGKTEFEFPNVLRVMLGENKDSRPEHEQVTVIETNIDDLNPQFYEVVMERLFAAGALDVFLSPIQMKKNRPGTLLRVIAPPDNSRAISAVVLRETSSLGVRISDWERICLDRRWEEVETEFGRVRMKIGEADGQVLTASPEYDDCKRAAVACGAPIKVVYDSAVAAYRSVERLLEH